MAPTTLFTLPIWVYILQFLVMAVSPIIGVVVGAIFANKNREADTNLKETQSQDTYFKQAVELSSQYREEIGRLRALVETLEKQLKEQENECDRKIKLLQDQINGLIGQLSAKSRRAIEEKLGSDAGL